MHVPTESAVLVSYNPLVLPVISHTGFQNHLSGLVFLMLDPKAGVPDVGLEPSFLREDLQGYDIPFLFWVTQFGYES